LQNLEPGRFVLHKVGRCEHVSRQHYKRHLAGLGPVKDISRGR